MATEFNEKPQTTTGLISGGFFVCEPSLFDYLGTGDDVSLEDGPMRTLATERRLAVFPHAGFWQPMDTYRDFQLLTTRFVSGEAPWAPWR
jgi:glucose-1-phosphate cytidylyltransferase